MSARKQSATSLVLDGQSLAMTTKTKHAPSAPLRPPSRTRSSRFTVRLSRLPYVRDQSMAFAVLYKFVVLPA